ncbi:MAG: zinc dependent phospholipase C family protein [Bacteroidota bacterium]
MNKSIYTFICYWLFLSQSAFGWGFWAHQRINRLAVFTLPPEMIVLYKAHIDYITEHAVDPDMRRYAIDGEAERHFIDIDHYGELPFENVPRDWQKAIEVIGEDTLQAFGILPYQLPRRMYELRDAFLEEDLGRIVKISAEIGHYVGDAHVPLHTTENYNGQLTGQKGIHGFWESRLPELFGESYNFFVGRSYFIEDVIQEGWLAVLESHTALDSVLSFERELNKSYAHDQKYGYESRKNLTIRTYSRGYAEAYHNMLGGMVERRMRRAILRTGAYWYTAWKLAGSPDLSKIAKGKLRIKPRKYKKDLNIEDRESGAIGLLRRTNTRFLCHALPHSAYYPSPNKDPHHLRVVALMRERRNLEIAQKQKDRKGMWEKCKEWVLSWA